MQTPLNPSIDSASETAAVIQINDSSQIGEARRLAADYSIRLAFNETTAGKVGIIVTEAAGNLIKHARNGLLVLTPINSGRRVGLEILALDGGPGVADLAGCLQDGYSSSGTGGSGLGAIRRLADEFDAHSRVGNGTAVMARLWQSPATRRALESDIEVAVGAVSLPIEGEIACGDRWKVVQQTDRVLAIVADGLGHGRLAAEAADAAVRIFLDNAHRRPATLLEIIHGALRSTRGAAIAIAEIDLAQQRVRYSGVGNISGLILGNGIRANLVSHNGIVGHQARKFQEFVYAWPESGTLVMHSDGLGSQWRMEEYPGLLSRDPSVITGVLYRDFNRGRDDVTVLALTARSSSFSR